MTTKEPVEVKDTTMIVARIPEDLHSQFKAWCAIRGESIQSVLTRLIEQEIKQK